jgi:hypothetical protein
LVILLTALVLRAIVFRALVNGAGQGAQMGFCGLGDGQTC